MQARNHAANEPARPLTFSEVLHAELTNILPGEAIPDARPPGSDDPGLPGWIDARSAPLAALCLSGGGIRSASFALGALQMLARAGVLRHFHYLSTVSGGGYVGAWLTAWRKQAGDDATVFAALNRLADAGSEPPEIAAIRANSNYLTPRYGILSADTWAVIAHYVRNLVLNWLVFGSFFLGALILPQLFARLLSELALQPPEWRQGLEWAGGAALTIGLSIATCGRLRTRGRWLTDKWYLCGVLVPVIIAAIFLTGAARMPQPPHGWLSAALAAASVYAIAAALGRLLARLLPGGTPDRSRDGTGGLPLLCDVVAWILAGALAGFLASAGGHLASHVRETAALADRDAMLVIFGASWIVLSVLAGELLYTGLTSYSPRADMDQEWLARSAGWMAAAAVSWAILAAIDLYGPVLLTETGSAVAALLAGGVSGAIAVLFGASAETAATAVRRAASRLSFSQIVGLAAVVFAAFLAMLLSWVDAIICGVMFDWLQPVVPPPSFPGSGSIAMFVLAAGLVLLSLILSIPINVNRFSLHAVYRNRLIRAFLGSARGGSRREPDPFTGFDPADNIPLAQSRPPGQHCLLHVVNVALNIVSGRRLAWQERKAEAFTFTALASGNPNVGYRHTAGYGARHGLSLGTAMAISGAAVSPNQGYHSSPLVGFLLMLFNVRLGWWLGNPRYRATAPRSGPWLGLIPALQELAGATSDERSWVYLSDGGHFENLGIYEMIRRRCRFVIVSDAGCDPGTGFDDLGNAVRKCFIDFGVRITFDALDVPARPTAGTAAAYCAIGRILYPGVGPDGWLLYVKPAYHGTEPPDIRSYALAHPDFPHEATSDQWFGESQFEAYRALGAHIFGRILSGDATVQAPLDLPGLRRSAEAYLAAATARNAAETARTQATEGG